MVVVAALLRQGPEQRGQWREQERERQQEQEQRERWLRAEFAAAAVFAGSREQEQRSE